MAQSVAVAVVDAFVVGGVVGSGNPAAVVCLRAPLPDTARQALAAKLGLAETAFVEPAEGSTAAEPFASDSVFQLRWFTPKVEVPLCGHATLAAAAVLFSEFGNASPSLSFSTRSSGPLVVSRVDGAALGAPRPLLQMSLPAAPAGTELPPSCRAELLHDAAAIGGAPASRSLVALLWACLSSLPAPEVPAAPHGQAPGDAPSWPAAWLSSVVEHVGFAAPLKYMLVVLKPGLGGGQALAAMRPDVPAMADALPGDELTGVIVATRAGPGDEKNIVYDFCLRFFGPWAGIPEDHVTGSAFTVAAPYFEAQLARDGRMRARQCSPRGGDVWLDVAGEPGRVLVAGEAVLRERKDVDLPAAS